MNDPTGDLIALRTAALRREWGQLQEMLTRVLLGLDFYAGLEIAVTRAHAHLPEFERAHPGAPWARSLLVSLVAYGLAPSELPPEASAPHPSPGAANYIMALFELCRAVERRTPLENRIRFLANAVGNTILAELAATWYADHPDAWALQQGRADETDEQSGLTVRQQVYTRFWLDDDTARRDTAAWLEIAEALARKPDNGTV